MGFQGTATGKGASFVDEANSLYLRIDPIRSDIIRVRFSKKEIADLDSLMIEEEVRSGKGCEFHVTEKQVETERGIHAVTVLDAGKLRAELDEESGRICYYLHTNTTDRLVLREGERTLTEVSVLRSVINGDKPIVERVKTVDGERNFIKNLEYREDRKAYRGQFAIDFMGEEGIYGFGQAEEGIFNLRHHNQYLYQHNMRIPMPMCYCDAGYGLLFDCTSLMTWNDDTNGSYLFLDTIDQMDYYVIAGPSPDEVIDGFRTLTGRAGMLPKWAYGYVQSKEQYYSSDELYEVVKHYRDLAVPLDVIVQDWNSWEPNHWGEKKLDPARYGNQKQRAEDIHKLHAHTMVSIWPNMNSNTSDYEEMAQKGYMLNDLSTYDAFNEEARRTYWEQAKKGLYEQGFDSWWCDSSEPFTGPDWNGEVKREPWERYKLVGDEHKKFLDPAKANAYALQHAKGIFENQKADYPDRRVLNLTRSGYASGQKYNAMLWSGDTYASWETLRKQIVEGLNMSISGYPFWTLDIGGFFTVWKKWQKRGCSCSGDPTPKWFWRGDYEDGVQDAGYRELYVRWIEYGTFLPMFRSHGTDTPREIWNFGKAGDPAYDAIAKFIRLRYQLMPYIYSLAGAVRLQNATILRSLLFDFAEDEKARTITDEFLFGPGLLICPVTRPMYYEKENRALDLRDEERNRICYLPKGATWIDFWTGERFEGGQEISRPTPLDQIPIFVKAGAILPQKEGLQYVDDKADEPVILEVIPGADGRFTLYEDAGEGYDYENGAYSTITLEWEDERDVLTIGTRQGEFKGCPLQRDFIVRKRGGSDVQIHYTGEEHYVYL